jgi:hypothetical protein
MSSQTLFSSLSVGTMQLPNRIVMAPLTRMRADAANAPTAWNAEYYAQRCSAGLIISEGTAISPQAQGYPNAPGIYMAAQIAGWRTVTDGVHARGGRIVMQIAHDGRESWLIVGQKRSTWNRITTTTRSKCACLFSVMTSIPTWLKLRCQRTTRTRSHRSDYFAQRAAAAFFAIIFRFRDDSAAEFPQRDRCRILASVLVRERRSVPLLANGLFHHAEGDAREVVILRFA